MAVEPDAQLEPAPCQPQPRRAPERCIAEFEPDLERVERQRAAERAFTVVTRPRRTERAPDGVAVAGTHADLERAREHRWRAAGDPLRRTDPDAHELCGREPRAGTGFIGGDVRGGTQGCPLGVAIARGGHAHTRARGGRGDAGREPDRGVAEFGRPGLGHSRRDPQRPDPERERERAGLELGQSPPARLRRGEAERVGDGGLRVLQKPECGALGARGRRARERLRIDTRGKAHEQPNPERASHGCAPSMRSAVTRVSEPDSDSARSTAR